MLYFTFNATVDNPNDVFVLPLTGDRRPYPFVHTKFNETRPRFSPDGRWVAYASSESGRTEVYVVPFAGTGGKWQVSITGGNFPRWRRDGGEIFYLSADNKLMAVSVNGRGETFELGKVTALFETPVGPGGYQYDVSPDGERFLLDVVRGRPDASPVTVVSDWPAGLSQ